MKKQSVLKTVILLLIPVLLFAFLVIPYQYVNREFIVDWLGCSCPRVDESGNLVESKFNANDFTACFWFVIALCAVILSWFISRKVFPNSKWIRALYVVCILIVSLMIAYGFTQSMMWK